MTDPTPVLEGRCPTHGTPLERRDDCGWCPACGLGYSMTWNGKEGVLSLHIMPRIPAALRDSSPPRDEVRYGSNSYLSGSRVVSVSSSEDTDARDGAN